MRKAASIPSLPAGQRTFAIASLIFAWICANGAVWDAVQVFAWARMFAGYAHTLPVRAALRETFDPGKPCEICMAVAKAKEAERKQAPRPLERSTAKLVSSPTLGRRHAILLRDPLSALGLKAQRLPCA